MESWGRLKGSEKRVQPLNWRQEAKGITKWEAPMLAYGMGRSYGDSCLIQDGLVLSMGGLKKLRAFDPKTGVISCEAGLTIAELLDFIVPRGWFIPVSPGTKFVTLGGAIANDIHGKNHHKRGTIGLHVLELELMRSNGELLECSPRQETELFRATIGGMGLTGLILSCSIQLIPIESAFIDAEMIKTKGLDDFFEVDQASEKDYEYTVSWIDCMASGESRGRGIYIRGNHRKDGAPSKEYQKRSKPLLTVPFNAPESLLNKASIKAFNFAYYNKQLSHHKYGKQAIDPFFYPLDAVGSWNRLYGKRGLLQYQFVIPPDRIDELKQIFDRIAKSGQGSFLAVLKRFGDVPSPGMMSFPKEGYTLTLDFTNKGPKSKELFVELDRMVIRAGGRLYAAKDATMSAETFQAGYPQWKEFSRFIDPKFTSMFWQRVTARV